MFRNVDICRVKEKWKFHGKWLAMGLSGEDDKVLAGGLCWARKQRLLKSKLS